MQDVAWGEAHLSHISWSCDEYFSRRGDLGLFKSRGILTPKEWRCALHVASQVVRLLYGYAKVGAIRE